MHDYVPSIVLYPMTDIGGGIFSLVVTAIFLQFWKPKDEWHFDEADGDAGRSRRAGTPIRTIRTRPRPRPCWAATRQPRPTTTKPLTLGSITLAWMPFVLMSILLHAHRHRAADGRTSGKASRGPVRSIGAHRQPTTIVPIPTLHKQVDPRRSALHEGRRKSDRSPKRPTFNFAWLTAPGTAVFFAALLSMVLLRMNRRRRSAACSGGPVIQMKIPIPTIAFMLGLSYVTRYAGMDATLGYRLRQHRRAVSVLRRHPGLARRLPDRHRRRQQRPVRQPAEDHRHADLQRRRVFAGISTWSRPRC